MKKQKSDKAFDCVRLFTTYAFAVLFTAFLTSAAVQLEDATTQPPDWEAGADPLTQGGATNDHRTQRTHNFLH